MNQEDVRLDQGDVILDKESADYLDGLNVTSFIIFFS